MIWFEKIFKTVVQTFAIKWKSFWQKVFAYSSHALVTRTCDGFLQSGLICLYVCPKNYTACHLYGGLRHVTKCRVWEDKIRHE